MRVPRHIAIIMDGNGRWAQKRGLPRVEGHVRGVKVLRRVVKWCLEFGVEYLTVFSFSTENWRRPKEEVDFLMDLFVDTVERELPFLVREGVKVRILGSKEGLPEKVVEKWREVEERTKNLNRMTLVVAFNYGGRREIVDAVKKIVEKVKNGEEVELSEENFRNFLYVPDVPDPDLIVRTSGELRLSNFLLWQGAYSELFFTKTLWPDFSKKVFLKALESYSKRERRFGGLQHG